MKGHLVHPFMRGPKENPEVGKKVPWKGTCDEESLSLSLVNSKISDTARYCTYDSAIITKRSIRHAW